MSMLSEQIKELREGAKVYDHMIPPRTATLLREAADTIESLRDRLEESERHNRINLEVIGEMYHPEVIDMMQECHATQANYEHCKYGANRGWCDSSRYAELFGTPERAARTLEHGKALCEWCDKQTCSTSGGECRIYDYDTLVEWLRGDA